MKINGYPVLHLEFNPDINFLGYEPRNTFTKEYLRSHLDQYGYLSMADWHKLASQAYLVSVVNDTVVYSSGMPELTIDQCELVKLKLASYYVS